MIRVSIHEAKARLSWYLERAAAGEDVVICKHNRPVAALRPIPAQPMTARPFGHAKGRFEVPSTFFDPLPEEEIERFWGSSAEPSRATAGGVLAVAEAHQTYREHHRKGNRRRKSGR